MGRKSAVPDEAGDEEEQRAEQERLVTEPRREQARGRPQRDEEDRAQATALEHRRQCSAGMFSERERRRARTGGERGRWDQRADGQSNRIRRRALSA